MKNTGINRRRVEKSRDRIELKINREEETHYHRAQFSLSTKSSLKKIHLSNNRTYINLYQTFSSFLPPLFFHFLLDPWLIGTKQTRPFSFLPSLPLLLILTNSLLDEEAEEGEGSIVDWSRDRAKVDGIIGGVIRSVACNCCFAAITQRRVRGRGDRFITTSG